MSDPAPLTAGKVFPPLLTAQQVADLLAVSVKTVERLTKQGKLPCYRLSDTRTRRFRQDDVQRLLVPSSSVDEEDDALADFITTNQKG